MRSILTPFLLIALTACSKEDAGDGEAEGAACTSSFTITGSDGAAVTMPDCSDQNVTVDFAQFPGSSLPQPHNLSIEFYGPGGASGDCWVSWSITGLCPDVTNYSIDNDQVSVRWDTSGCGLSSGPSGAFEAASGSSSVTKFDSQPEAGLADGSPMRVEIAANLDAETADGTRLEGAIDVNSTVDLFYTELGACAGSGSGDEDGDGYASVEFGGEDCNDDDPSIGPHATEVCDEIDNNCDGAIDEDTMSTFYPDLDGDGWGDPEGAYEACGPNDGDVDNGGDCNDADASVKPEVDDICDGVDNDCDDLIDEDGEEAFYPDTDDDGYGADDEPPEIFCDGLEPEGYVKNFDDCDDDSADINPDADEVCDSEDNDCDGLIDEDLECPDA